MTRLDDALQALREDVGGASPDAGRTRAKVIASMAQTHSRRRVRPLALLAATFVLVAASAWALSTRGPGPHGASPFTIVAAPSAMTLKAPLGVPTSLDVPATTLPPPTLDQTNAPSDPNPGATSLPAPTTGHDANGGSAARVPRVGRAIPALTNPRSTEELAAYASAHRAHFVDRNPTSALALWNGYLERYPGTRWEPEARYNRALCLVRLQQTKEAQEALAAFANGDYGGYRKREASALAAALIHARR